MNKRVFIISLLGIVLLSIGGYVTYQFFTPASQPQASIESPYTVPPLVKPYSNNVYRFSLKMPEDFVARQVPGLDGAEIILLEDATGQGVQITVTPFDEDLQVLTKEQIQEEIPDLQIVDPQSVEIGTNHTGLAFKSDNEFFDGASREVWFVFKGNLYQISTFMRLDDLLRQLFATWQFF